MTLSIEQFSMSASFHGIGNLARLQEEPADMVSFVYGVPVKPRMMEIAIEFLRENYPQYTMPAILGESRLQGLVRARHHVWWEVRRQRPDVSWMAMGRRFNRDHSTIINGVRKHETRTAA